MTPEEQKKFVDKMYDVIFQQADVDKIPDFFADDFVEDNNYDVLDYDAFVVHVKDLKTKSKPDFSLEYLVNVPGTVVVRCIVTLAEQIAGSPPVSLLISYWGFNDKGLVNRCIEVEASSS